MQPFILPFFGLGYDLSRALLQGAALRLTRLSVFRTEAYSSQYYPPSGIDLLIYLNRETGGS